MIPVTKAYLPNKEKYKSYIDRIFESNWVTNNGEILKELEERLKVYLGVKHIILVANGSLALQLAYKALNIKGEVITSPFSFVATTSTLAWEGINPRFADIDLMSLNIDIEAIEPLITQITSAIVPVHVYGNPCNVESIASIAKNYNLKIIYDAAHAFNTKYKSESVLNYGDISTLSFHATKLFHTIEGGAVITNDDDIANRVRLLINFGITGPTSIESVGTNAKMNEFEAAMGMCILDDIELIIEKRRYIWNNYTDELANFVNFQEWNHKSTNNYSYAPILLKNETELLEISNNLMNNKIYTRRYFYPSLDTLNYIKDNQICKNSRDISRRVLCLPIYHDLDELEQIKIINIIKKTLHEKI